nr:ATP-binding cassette domain-containing protein [Pseudopedobacter sp.]
MNRDKPIISIYDGGIFQGHSLILSDITFNIYPSEFVYLIGATGSGKSTLLKVLYAELKLEDGTGEIAGFALKDFKKSDIPKLRRKLGVVFQDFQLLFDRDAFDNLAFVLKATGWKKQDEINSRIKEVLTMVELDTKAHKMPFELSGGEQQRLAIARALLNKPAIILADEPTGNLDPKTSDGILFLLHDISESGTAVLMATHDYRIMDKFPGIIMKCEGGKVTLKRRTEE